MINTVEYGILAVFVLLLIVLFVWIAKKNKKDKKILEDKIIQTELGPEKKDESNNENDSL
ncbi:hypothetical protein Pedsa_0030 [Pseudopedobacter saltans DSM 12145]|uniref:Uncharacterized protein n=1 Tax=Pseudopedobacter saltans (strain ATCC 51119 / DSM 12145 / JCM 21818 / CCUG 39354 / LMG 10337 / NBRC 100064 / NCIMB 13643) TaxID=762903 RepID=F0SC34_PSESL|nr:hypothetical protein [Pseudopedobacter saltans]ADY50619.1 hypothetical protein Pedsa_0030 [Pseudopedobacter saltans DSM 12145]